jgi:uncharacterized protein YndB with AHSA1/START domain
VSAAHLPAEHHTFVIDRNFPQPRGQVFTALANPATVRRWYLESETKDVHSFEMDFQVGGRERATYTHKGGTPVDGVPFVNEGCYLDIVPDQRIVSASAMTAESRRISASLVTYELTDLPDGGTQLRFTHQGAFFEGADGPRWREMGWQALLGRLATTLGR